VSVANTGEGILAGVILTIDLPPDLVLLGPPTYERGSGCRGRSSIRCNLDFLTSGMSTTVHLAVRVAPRTTSERQTIEATSSGGGIASGQVASFTVVTGA
jgi:hypothetical protein